MFQAYNYFIYLLLTNKKAFETFKWAGNISTYIAAILIAVSVSFAEYIWPFFLYLVGSIVWFLASLIIKDRALMWLQMFFVAINTYAICVRL